MTSFDRPTLFRSAVVAVALSWSIRAIGLVSVVVLARLLQPSDFGIVALALTAAAFIEFFGWIGLRQALLRVREPERSHYDTAWTIQLVLFLFLAAALVAVAPLAADFYGMPPVKLILWAMSLRLVCLAFVNIGIVDFEREMQFGRDMRMRLGVRVAALFVSLAAAFILRNYWALVIGMVAQSILYTIASFVAHPYRPRLALSRRAEILGVSLWMFLCTLSELIQQQVERLVLGRIVLSATVGLYSVSKDLSSIFTQEIATALNRVTFVAVAGTEDSARSTGNVARVVGGYATVVAPLAAGLVATAPDAVAVLLGPQWMEAAPLLRIIAVATGIQAVYMMTSAVLQASGHARRAAFLNLAGAALSVAAVVGAGVTYRTPEAIAAAALCVNSVMLLAGVFLLARNAGASAVSLTSNLSRPVLAGALMVAMLTGPLVIESGAAILDLMWSVTMGALLYASALAILWFASGRPEGAESEAALLLASLRQRLRTS